MPVVLRKYLSIQCFIVKYQKVSELYYDDKNSREYIFGLLWKIEEICISLDCYQGRSIKRVLCKAGLFKSKIITRYTEVPER